ncbi:MAG TPA: prepilin peptidase [Clostridia bacterium]|nr:prepilin peptidase [Clostridia bacterium]
MAILSFVLGLVTGSFLNVCIYRIPREESVVYGHSRCPHCNTELGVKDLIPVMSYLLLKGRCRYCRESISIQYPLVELLTGVVFLLTYLATGWHILLLKYWFLFSILIVITFIDIKLLLIPNRLILMILNWWLLWQVLEPEISWGQSLVGSLLGGGILLAIAVLSKGAMGGGDIKLMFAAGLMLGGPAVLLALFISFVSGALGGGFLLATGVKKLKEPIPFGPFLAVGIFVAALWGEELIQLYLFLSGIR